MNVITESKSVGQLSYFVRDLETLYTIILSGQIKQSKNQEYNKSKHEKSNYISLSRNLTAAAIRNNDRWRYGIVIDGNRLSDRYHIEPYSFNGVHANTNQFKIKELTAYDDGTYKVRLVNWSAIPVSQQVFEYLESRILDAGEDFNDLHKLEIQNGGTRKINGHKIVTKYLYNNAQGDHGDILHDTDKLPHFMKHLLFRSDYTNEYEERIWTNSNYINIKGCILGVIFPKDELSDFETTKDPSVKALRYLLDEQLYVYTVTYY